MADPQKFTPGYAYTGTVIPNFPGSRFDQDFMNIETSIDETVEALKDVRRSDGKLNNGIVTVDSLDPTVAAGVGSGALASAAAAAASADAANDSKAAAEGSADAAAGSAAASLASATDASSRASSALAYRDEALTAQAGAQTARDFAYQWSSAASGVDVNDGVNPINKSAYHWAQVALAAAAGSIADGSITTVRLANGAVTQVKLADGALSADNGGRAKMADGFVTSAKLADGVFSADAAGLAKMADGYLSADSAGRAKVANGFVTSPKLDSALVTELKWLSKAVGEYYWADDGVTGVDIPPASTTGSTVWIELTAALTGPGQYNEGKLSSESVSGSAPLVQATASVALSGSPLNGQTVRLINTERRFLRAGSAGTAENDALQGHYHRQLISTAGAIGANPQSSGTATVNSGTSTDTQGVTTAVTDGTNGAPRIANETRPKNFGVRAFRRIK
jgi:hypothetical protein